MHDDFSDTIAIPRRQDFRPEWYKAAHAASEIDDDANDALRTKVRGARVGALILLAGAMLVIGSIAALAVWW